MSSSSSALLQVPGVERRSRFAVAMAVGMLIVNLVGFGPTLYLRALFDVPPIPAYLYAHGAIGTAWFALLVAQTMLVAHGRVGIHRSLGVAGAAVALLVLISGMYTSAHMVPRNAALGLTSESDIVLYTVVTGADNAAFIVFPTLVLLGLYFRRRPEVHRRLMLLSAWSILGPAVARILNYTAGFPNPMGPLRFIGPIIILGFIAAMLINDIVSRHRPHVVTVLGTLFFMVVNISIQLSGLGATLVERRLGQ